jgi:hypothetical protein
MTKTKPKPSDEKKAKKPALNISEDEDLTREELSGHRENHSLNVSDTDEDENEGVGGGNIERSDEDVFKDK